VKSVRPAAIEFIFLHLVHCFALKNGKSVFILRSFLTDLYKLYKIMRNYNTGYWKATFEIATI
jgi:hypothetical protein